LITLCKQPTDEVLFRGFGTCFQLLGSKKVLICFKTVWGPSGDVLGPSGGRCWVSGLAAVHGPWVSGFAPPRTLGFGFRPAADLGFRVSGVPGVKPRWGPTTFQRQRLVAALEGRSRGGGSGGAMCLGSAGRVASGGPADILGTKTVSAVFRVSLFGGSLCFVFHFSAGSRVSCYTFLCFTCFVFRLDGG
jgi:hypothetical protein